MAISPEELYEQVLSAVEGGDLRTARQLLVGYKYSGRSAGPDTDLNRLLRQAIHSEHNQIVELLLDVGEGKLQVSGVGKMRPVRLHLVRLGQRVLCI